MYSTDNSSKLNKLSIKVLFSLNKNTYMKDSGIIIKEMEEELNSGKVDLSMKATGRITLLMVTED